MITINRCLFVFAILVFISCGNKKEGDFSKPTSEEIETNTSLEPASEINENEKQPVAGNVNEGKKIFEGKGTCSACHQPSAKIIGPSLQEISKIYKDKKANMVTFLKGEGEPIVDPSQYDVMKTNFAITKQMSDQELYDLQAYIYSF
ncbi:c-type cytochrome [Flavobacterium sp.]|uniref:c-type cytochrome n=1 Tax=Flavobacterium sp. TaxID=239 RepID=UPI0035290595